MSVAATPLSRTAGGGAAPSGWNDQNARCSAVIALACEATGRAAAAAGAGHTAPPHPLGERVDVGLVRAWRGPRHRGIAVGVLHRFEQRALVGLAGRRSAPVRRPCRSPRANRGAARPSPFRRGRHSSWRRAADGSASRRRRAPAERPPPVPARGVQREPDGRSARPSGARPTPRPRPSSPPCGATASSMTSWRPQVLCMSMIATPAVQVRARLGRSPAVAGGGAARPAGSSWRCSRLALVARPRAAAAPAAAPRPARPHPAVPPDARRRRRGGGQPRRVGDADDAVWLPASADPVVRRIDAKTNAVTADGHARSPRRARRWPLAFDSVWVPLVRRRDDRPRRRRQGRAGRRPRARSGGAGRAHRGGGRQRVDRLGRRRRRVAGRSGHQRRPSPRSTSRAVRWPSPGRTTACGCPAKRATW